MRSGSKVGRLKTTARSEIGEDREGELEGLEEHRTSPGGIKR